MVDMPKNPISITPHVIISNLISSDTSTSKKDQENVLNFSPV